MTTGQEFLRNLLEGAEPEKLAAFLKTIKPDAPAAEKKDPQREHGPIKTYTTVVKNYTCLACDSKFSATHQMSKGEVTFCVSQVGKVTPLAISGKPGVLELSSYTIHCHLCALVAAEWSREKLISKWISLSSSCSFKEVAQQRSSLLEK